MERPSPRQGKPSHTHTHTHSCNTLAYVAGGSFHRGRRFSIACRVTLAAVLVSIPPLLHTHTHLLSVCLSVFSLAGRVDPVVVHNNYIIGYQPKLDRFKANGLVLPRTLSPAIALFVPPNSSLSPSLTGCILQWYLNENNDCPIPLRPKQKGDESTQQPPQEQQPPQTAAPAAATTPATTTTTAAAARLFLAARPDFNPSSCLFRIKIIVSRGLSCSSSVALACTMDDE